MGINVTGSTIYTSEYDKIRSIIGSQEPMPRTPKGTIKIDVDRGWLKLRWTYQKKRYAMALGMEDTVINRRLAQTTADIIKADIAANHFDNSLTRYRPGSDALETITVTELFEKYTAWKRRQITKRSLDKYQGLIPRLNQYFKTRQASVITEDQALDFRDWLLKSLSTATVRERIVMMRACWLWAIGKKVLIDNPWENVRIKAQQRPRPFTQQEYSQILDGFQKLHPDYADFVTFVMGIGCRLGEAAGLRWGHLSDDCSKIWIGESWGRGERKPTKTYKDRAFQLSVELATMLHRRKPASAGNDDLVFMAANGGPIDDHNFRRRYWTPVLESIGVPYRKPYSMRHSFISQAVDQGWSISEISSITGNSEETILRSYTGGVKGTTKLKSVWAVDKIESLGS